MIHWGKQVQSFGFIISGAVTQKHQHIVIQHQTTQTVHLVHFYKSAQKLY